MSIFPITYEQALEWHPTEVTEVMADLRASRSKNRLAAPETLNWYYMWWKAFKSTTFQEILSNPLETQPEPTGHHVRVLDGVGVCLCGSIGRGRGMAAVFSDVPKSLADYLIDEHIRFYGTENTQT